jgi:hypothetical protein
MSIKNNKTAIELLSLIASLMNEDDLAELRAAMGNDTPDTDPDPDEWDGECPANHNCNDCRYELICGTPDDPQYADDDEDEDDEWDGECPENEGDYCDYCEYRDRCDVPEREDEDALTIAITVPEGMPCVMMGGTDDELPLAMELIKEMGLVSPAPAPTKSRVRGERVNRNQSVPEGSISGRTLREMIKRAVEAAKEPAEGSAAWLDKYHY